MKSSYTKSAYLKLLEYQDQRKLPTYPPDYPLVFFIVLSRIASGISIVSVFFSSSLFWSVFSMICMTTGILFSIGHLSVPHRFITMIRNNRSLIVWETRLAGTLTMILAAQSIYLLQPAGGLEPVLTWMGCILSVLFLISTGLAYRFLAHPVWGSSMLPAYYVISATLIGFSLRAIGQPFTTFPIVFNLLVITQMILLIRYKNDIKTSSEKVLGELKKNPLKWILRGFLSASLFAPAALAMVSLLGRTHSLIYALIGFSCFMGMILERILFFRVERPNLFFSFIRHPGKKGDRLIRG